jgi:transcriptional regulator with XRE-family HTH domain
LTWTACRIDYVQMSRRQVRTFEGSSFGQRVREARKHKGLSQEGLAREVDVTLRTIQRWEDGSSDPAGAQVMRLARVLAVDPAALYPETEEAA